MLKALLFLTALALVQARPGEEQIHIEDRNCGSSKAGCGPVIPTTLPPPLDQEPCETLENGCPVDWHIHRLLPHEEYCHKFYYCDKGELVERYCAPGTYFHYDIQVCDWPYNVDCVNDGSYEYPSTPEPEDNPPDIGDVLDNGCPSDFSIHHLLPHESECDKFYYCVFGEKVERTCAEGTHFNFEIQVCDWPQNAGCEFYVPPPNPCDATTAGPGGCNPAPEPSTTAAPSPCDTTTAGPGGCNPAPEPSTTAVPSPCDTTTAGPGGCNPVPEPSTTAVPSPCDTTTAGPGGCNPVPEPSTTAVPSPCDTTTAGPGGCGTLPNNCPADPNIHWLLPHESDCSKFYYCVWGELVERDCPEGTHFNPILQVCDWPQDAGCEFYVPPTTRPCDATTAGPGGCDPVPTPTTPSTTTTTLAPSPCDTTTAGPGGCGTLPNNCPADPNIHWLLPHERDCSKFYYCVWGELVERDCPAGTHFNPTLQVCDWPQDAGCEFYVPPTTRPCDATTAGPGGCDPVPTPTTPSTTTTTLAPSPCDTTTAGPGGCGTLPNNCPADPNIHWLLPHESDCSKFYYCVWGELVERDCPAGTHFNPTLQVCDWPQDAGCEFYVPPTTRPCDATTAGPGGCDPVPTPTTPSTTTTTTTLAPSPCDTTTAGPGGCGTLPNNCPADPNIHWLLPHESDCSKFYYCVWGELVERDCPAGTHFNPTLQVCDWPQDAGCEFYVPPTTRPCDATTAGPGGCDPVPTPTTPSTTTTTLAPSPCDTTTAGPGGCGTLPNNCPADPNIHWLLPHESDCSKFYYCVWGELVERDCPAGTHFNPTLQVCDWPQDAGCEFYVPPTTRPCDATTAGPGGCDPVPTPTTPSTTTTTLAPSPCDTTTAGPGGCGTLPNNCPADPNIHWLLPHESDCSKFYYCVWGELVERDCPAGTHFNPTLQVCDWPQDAGCEFYVPPTTRPCDATTAGPGGCDPVPTPTTSSTTTTTTTLAPSPCDTTTAGPGGCGTLPNNCPADPNIHWLLPHESDCSKFYYCVWGELVERDCPAGTHFNPTLQVCDWPQDAGCEFYVPPTTRPCDATTAGPGGCDPVPTPTTPSTTTTTTTLAPSPCDTTTAGPGGCGTLPNNCPADPNIHWLLPHESDCSKFYYCVWGELVERDCPAGTHFNPTLQVCDWPQDAGCEFYVPPTTRPCDATTAGPGGCDPVPTPTTPSTTTTTTTLAPSPCDTTTAGPGGCGTLPNNCPADPNIHWLLPHESDCSKFYYCVWGELVERDCPAGTHFNPTLQVCDWPQDAGCEFYVPPTTRPCDATTAGPGGCDPVPTPTTPSTTTTTTTLAPSPCDTTTAGPGGCGTLPNNCPADPNIHWLLPHESDCSKFYYCVWGELVERDCPAGTHFNPTLQVCDWPQDAGCEFYVPPTTRPCDATTAGPGGCDPVPVPTTPSTTTTTTTLAPSPCDTTTAGPGGCGTLPNNCPADPNIHWLLPHESDCSKFYYCVWGELVERDCPDGTHFNPNLQVCDWPQDAGCEFYVPPTTRPCDATTAGPGGCDPVPTPTTPSTTTTTTTLAPSPCDTTTAGPGGCNPDVEDRCINECNVAPWAHDTDCDKYWICNGGQSVLITCSEGLHFNPSTNTCDFICNAGCVRGSV